MSEAARDADPASLDDEFHALFIGLGRGEVLPYASWYLSGFLMDKPLARLRADLDTLGIERADSVSEPEDHVAALCETMVLLVDADAGVDHATQKQFFDRHLQPWFPRFFADVRAARSTDFYRSVADLGQGFFEFEESWLSLPQ
ncbi:MAG: TorD/DmsD family molecular chaperone [Candidatus Wenzhouxiangella sp. M2_3B_020]